MTQLDLRDSLLTRVGFRQEADLGFTVDADNLTSDSGRFFQDEHPFVTLHNLKAFADPQPESDSVFNALMDTLRDRAVMGTIADVIETPEVPDNLITGRENIFDNAIIKRMSIIIGEIMLTSKRSNLSERVGKEFMQRLFFEINGNEGNPAMPKFIGLRSRYEQEVRRLKGLLGHRKSLNTVTYKNVNYLDDEILKWF